MNQLQMNQLLVTYADGTTEEVYSDLSAGSYFDSRFGGLDEDVKAKCNVKEADAPVKAKAKK